MPCDGKPCGSWSRKVDVSWDGTYDYSSNQTPNTKPTKYDPQHGKNGPAGLDAKVQADESSYARRVKQNFDDGGIAKCLEDKENPCICAKREPAKPDIFRYRDQVTRTMKGPLASDPNGLVTYTVDLTFTWEEPSDICKQKPKIEFE